MPDTTDPTPVAPERHALSFGMVRRIYGNLGKLLGGKAVAGVVSLVYLVIAVRALGTRDYGVLILVHTYVITVGGIIEFPGWQGVVRYGALANEAGDTPRLIRLLRLSTVIEIVGGVVAIVVAAALAPWIGPRLGWSPAAIAFAVPYSLAVLATIRSTPAGYLQLRGRFDLLGLHNVISPLVRLVGAVIAVAVGAGLRGFLIAWLVAALAEWVSMWAFGLWVVRRDLAGERLAGSPRGAISENPGIRRFMLAANADVTFGDLSQRLTSLIIGWVMGPVATGIFAVAQRATAVIAQPAGNLGQAAYAEMARLIAAGGRGHEIRRAFVKSVTIAFAVAVPLVVLIAFFGPAIARLIGGRQFGPAGTIMLWLFAARAILLVGPPASAALVAMGMPGTSFFANLICSLGLLPFLPLAMAAFGLAGAGAFALVQAACTAAMLGGLLWRRTSG
ncbi:oligosaccharide flippase family protein [Sphingomonas sp.]|uniref:lipopolysaccharide biosynthesis protein n=1 Tax=Sphingomonas sp. TaxID=28214 RepID=UPI00286C65CA|nr:oligosaccharide flippase family protein [Sphingomonas sp.]